MKTKQLFLPAATGNLVPPNLRTTLGSGHFAARKCCAKCKAMKPREAFYKSKHHTDGLYSQCKVCHNLTAAESNLKHRERVVRQRKKYQSAHKAEINFRRRVRVASDPEYRARRISMSRLWYQRNKERHSERLRKWRMLNQDKIRRYRRSYNSLNQVYKKYREKHKARINYLRRLDYKNIFSNYRQNGLLKIKNISIAYVNMLIRKSSPALRGHRIPIALSLAYQAKLKLKRQLKLWQHQKI